MSGSVVDTPIIVAKSLPAIKVEGFEYQPHRSISQYETAVIGCPFCDPDGSRMQMLFAQPINQIIQFEAETALKEVMIADRSNATCSIKANIQYVGAVKGTAGSLTYRVDATYTLGDGDATYFMKRAVGEHKPSLFTLSTDVKMWARPVRESIRQLVSDPNFNQVIDERCRNI